MAIWLITDCHFHHRKIIELAKRPEDYEQQIVDNWKNQVQPTDTVINLGDLNLGRDGQLIDLLAQLPGYHVLIRGNHDHHSPSWYERHGINLCLDELRRGEYLFTHEPKMGLDGHTRANIFGHWHGDDHRYAEVMDNPYYQHNKHRYWHLHIEGTFAPVRLDDFLNGRRESYPEIALVE